jgi:hypothetical protein
MAVRSEEKYVRLLTDKLAANDASPITDSEETDPNDTLPIVDNEEPNLTYWRTDDELPTVEEPVTLSNPFTNELLNVLVAPAA